MFKKSAREEKSSKEVDWDKREQYWRNPQLLSRVSS
jgi:hypothetical protein